MIASFASSLPIAVQCMPVPPARLLIFRRGILQDARHTPSCARKAKRAPPVGGRAPRKPIKPAIA